MSAAKVQEPLAGMLAPLKVRVVPPAVAAALPPAQVVAALAGLARVMPLGKLSVTATPVMTVALALDRVTVRRETPPAPILAGENALATPGPVSPLLTADTVMAVPGPAPSGSMVATFWTVPPLCADTWNCTVAVAPTAITPAAFPGLLTNAAVAKGITPPEPSGTATPLSLVLPATYTVPAGIGSARVVPAVSSRPVLGMDRV